MVLIPLATRLTMLPEESRPTGGRCVRRVVAAVTTDDDDDGPSDADSDGETDYSDDDEDFDTLALAQLSAEYEERVFHMTDLDRLVWRGKVCQETGLTSIAVNLISVKTCRNMEAALRKRGKLRDKRTMQLTTDTGGVTIPQKEMKGRTEFAIMLQAIFDKLPRRRDGKLSYQSPLEMCVAMVYATVGREEHAPRIRSKVCVHRASVLQTALQDLDGTPE